MSNKKLVVLNSATDNFANMVANETLRLLQSRSNGDAATIEALISGFTARFIGVVAYQVLAGPHDPMLSKEEQFQNVSKKFANLKADMQEAVAAGFSAAMSHYTKKPVEYLCQVTVVPPPFNKQPC